MKSFRLMLLLAIFMSPMLYGEEKNVSNELFGKLALGQSAETLKKVVGEPEGKGKEVLWEAIGEWVQDWKFSKQGLTVAMASGKKGGAKTIFSLTASAGCSLATARGIKIGSPESAARKAYAKEKDKEQSPTGETFIAGSIYGGVIFSFTDGKVSQIFIGAAAE
ncbi:hypothetical protein BH11VER1_BH11VER1_40830 [soil metagenome]